MKQLATLFEELPIHTPTLITVVVIILVIIVGTVSLGLYIEDQSRKEMKDD